MRVSTHTPFSFILISIIDIMVNYHKNLYVNYLGTFFFSIFINTDLYCDLFLYNMYIYMFSDVWEIIEYNKRIEPYNNKGIAVIKEIYIGI